MKRFPITTERCRIPAIAALVLLGAMQIWGQAAPPQGARELVLTAGKSLVVNSAADIERVAVGYGDIAEARAIGPREVLLDGKAPGETTLIIWQAGGNKLFFDLLVRPNTSLARGKLENVRRQMLEELPGQRIAVKLENDTVFLTGNATDLNMVERAQAIAATMGKVVNLLYVDVPGTDTQILLKVQFASVDRNLSTDLGMNLISTGGANTIGRFTTGQFAPPIVENRPGQGPTVTLSDALNFFLFRPDINLGATIRALQTRGLVEILAEPNVLAMNGKQASFLAGGEFPYPILQGGGGGIGTVTIAFREYGIRLTFLPVITPRGTIRLDVAPEVSALDPTAGLTISGFTIPAITSRKMQTEIELSSGQSFAIAGLLDRRLTETLQKVPLLSSVPVLGKLFQSKSLLKQNTELLVIVTPEIVRPMQEGQPRPALTLPQPLWGSETAQRTPGLDATGPAPTSTAASIPVEKLIESLKMQSEMKLSRSTETPQSLTPAILAPQTTAPAKQ